MAIKLVGDVGYFCEIVALDGDTFRLRELEDGENSELEQYREFAEKRADALQAIAAIQRKALDESTETLAGVEGEQDRPIPRPFTTDEMKELRRLDREELRLHGAANDFAVKCGVVGWSLKDEAGSVVECSPENVLLLPTWVKARLADRIMAHTALMPGEGDFLDSGLNASPKAKH